MGGFDVFVERGDWPSALEGAAAQGPDMLNRYLMRYAKFTMESNQFGETVKAFDQYGVQAVPQNYPIYKTLVLEVLQDCDAKEIAHLRSMLFKFVALLEKKNELMTPAGKEFKKLLLVSHLVHLSNTY